ncbi:DUF262 domain-containing protein [Phocaeicola plebeius]|uniref:DUF262 domain-containing protein n=1 Tax=Phocaeicola plebeius TaxID=310297 RepID=UPI0019579D4D|nr:DUF262 domain-containing protein [Phocaeicola plebeius]MBM6843062.1 DUF262 domain-containing protein [Phocaeicola plebeius]
MSVEDVQIQDNQEVEVENLNGGKSTEEITKPFNPNEIDVYISTVNLGSLIDQLENDEIDLQPDFQRVTDVWDNVKKSRLIESILLGLPLPSFYFSEDPVSQKLSIIDGLQRICAIRDFVLEKENPLKLEGLQFLKNFEGFTFSQLARPEVKRIKSLKITMNTLRKGTPLDVKYIIFQRVNTAGVPLTPQEMRHALNQGPAAIFIKELADMESFKKATNYSVESKRMQDRDFVNRFIAFYIGYQDYMGDLDMFLNDKMGELNKMTSEQKDDIRVSFDKAMKCCYEIFKNDAFRKKYSVTDKRKPISKSVYDTLSVNIAWLSDEEQLMLLKNAEAFKTGMIRLFNDERFNFSISTGTGQKYNVDLRFTMVKSLIKEIISL